jgi:hypothetical protein
MVTKMGTITFQLWQPDSGSRVGDRRGGGWRERERKKEEEEEEGRLSFK